MKPAPMRATMQQPCSFVRAPAPGRPEQLPTGRRATGRRATRSSGLRGVCSTGGQWLVGWRACCARLCAVPAPGPSKFSPIAADCASGLPSAVSMGTWPKGAVGLMAGHWSKEMRWSCRRGGGQTAASHRPSLVRACICMCSGSGPENSLCRLSGRAWPPLHARGSRSR